MKITKSAKALVLAFISLFFVSSIAKADGGLMVTPNRVDFKPDVNSQEVKLINRGNETTTYRISFQNLKMNPDGTYDEINETNKGDEKFADKFVKFSPKKVTLKPGETQTIRLMVNRPKDKAEYRSHLLFREEVPASFGNDIEKKAKGDKNISVTLRPVFGISIPVIISNSNSKSEVTIDDVALETDAKTKNKFVSMTLNRQGDSSVNGSVVVTLNNKEIGSVSNVSVYNPYPSRTLKVNLELPKGEKLDKGALEVKFYAAAQSESVEAKRGSVIAQKSITIN